MRPQQVLPHQVRMDLRVIAMKGYSILLRCPELEPQDDSEATVL